MAPREPEIARRRKIILLAVSAAFLALAFAWLTPLGESPDELAHIRYAEALADGRLPQPTYPGHEEYESHQPPLGYLIPAAVIASFGGLDLHPTPNPALDFHDPGSRAFLPEFATGRDGLILRLARSSQAIWAVVLSLAAVRLTKDLRTAVPFLLAPQLLFVCSGLNNDAALIALSTCALVALVQLAQTGKGGLIAGLFVVAALFTKGSALLLLVPVAVAAFAAARISRLEQGSSSWSESTLLLAVCGGGLLTNVVLQIVRFGSIVPPLPTAHRVASVTELVTDPSWLLELFGSYWAKFGWLNVPMPWPAYVFFAGFTLCALTGVSRSPEPARRVLLSAVVANGALLLVYLLFVDRQPQGRYLLPTIAALPFFAEHGSMTRFRGAFPYLAALLAVAALWTVHVAYS